MFAADDILRVAPAPPPRTPSLLAGVAHRLQGWRARGGVMQRLYLGGMILAGMLVLGDAVRQVLSVPPGVQWLMVAALTVLSGAATLRVPNVPVTFSISDSFTIAAALLFGPAAGTLTVAIDSLVMSLRQEPGEQTLRRCLFNAAAPALAMWLAAHLFFALMGVGPLIERRWTLDAFVGSVAVFAAAYFILNTAFVAAAVAIEQRLPIFAIWRRLIGLSLTYFGGAAVAALLVVLVGSFGQSPVVLALVAPIPLILYITFKTAVGRFEDQLAHLGEVNRMHLATVEALAHAIDAKDQVTHGHLRRVQHYAMHLARALRVTDEAQLRAIEAASLLHDLGKLAVPEHILNKPGKLTPAEFDKMKLHASVGADILAGINFPYAVVPIVRHHHERWDGTGYPAGLRGEAIPIGARILAVADCFDALTSDRPYRPKLPREDALTMLEERSGTLYDPRVVRCFLEILDVMPEPPQAPAPIEAVAAITLTRQADTRHAFGALDPNDPALIVAFYDLGTRVAEAGDTAAVVEAIHEVFIRLMPAASTALFFYNPAADSLCARCVAGRHKAELTGLTIPRGQRLTGWVAAHRQTIVNSEAALDLGNLTLQLTPTPHGCLSIPVCDGVELLAVLTIYSTAADGFSDMHVAVAEAIAARLATVLQRGAAAVVAH